MKRIHNHLFQSFLICLVSIVMSCDSSDDDEIKKITGSSIAGCQLLWNEPFKIKYEGDLGTGFIESLNKENDIYLGLGYSFTTAYNGKVKEFKIKMFENSTTGKKVDYTIRLYDAALHISDILAEKIISVEDDQWHSIVIDPIAVDKDHSYIVCVYIKVAPLDRIDYYSLEDFTYPVTNGDLTVNGYAVTTGLEMRKPSAYPSSDLLSGLVDICFEAD